MKSRQRQEKKTRLQERASGQRDYVKIATEYAEEAVNDTKQERFASVTGQQLLCRLIQAYFNFRILLKL